MYEPSFAFVYTPTDKHLFRPILNPCSRNWKRCEKVRPRSLTEDEAKRWFVVGVEVMKKEWNKDDGDKTEMECLFAERSFTVCCRRRRSSLQKWQWGRTFRRLLRISYLNGGQQKDQREMGNRDRAATLSLPASVGPLKREAVASSGRRTEGTPRQMKRNEK